MVVGCLILVRYLLATIVLVVFFLMGWPYLMFTAPLIDYWEGFTQGCWLFWGDFGSILWQSDWSLTRRFFILLSDLLDRE